MAEFLKSKFKPELVSEKEVKTYVYTVKCDDIKVEVSINVSNNTLNVYCWDYDLSYTYRWVGFNSDKGFKEFVGQPRDIHYFLTKLGVKKDELNFSASKTKLYSYSRTHFKKGTTKEERQEWLELLSKLDKYQLQDEFYGDFNEMVHSCDYIEDDVEINFNVYKYSRPNLIIINALLKVMEIIEKEYNKEK